MTAFLFAVSTFLLISNRILSFLIFTQNLQFIHHLRLIIRRLEPITD